MLFAKLKYVVALLVLASSSNVFADINTNQSGLKLGQRDYNVSNSVGSRNAVNQNGDCNVFVTDPANQCPNLVSHGANQHYDEPTSFPRISSTRTAIKTATRPAHDDVGCVLILSQMYAQVWGGHGGKPIFMSRNGLIWIIIIYGFIPLVLIFSAIFFISTVIKILKGNRPKVGHRKETEDNHL